MEANSRYKSNLIGTTKNCHCFHCVSIFAYDVQNLSTFQASTKTKKTHVFVIVSYIFLFFQNGGCSTACNYWLIHKNKGKLSNCFIELHFSLSIIEIPFYYNN